MSYYNIRNRKYNKILCNKENFKDKYVYNKATDEIPTNIIIKNINNNKHKNPYNIIINNKKYNKISTT